MRYRNIEPLTVRRGRGNLRTSAIGRETRARLFSPGELAAPFEPDMRRAEAPTLVIGEETFSHESAQSEWQQERPVPQMPDMIPVNEPAQDRRRGGRDAYKAGEPSPGRRRYLSDDGAVSRELNVAVPTAANLAQVLNALLEDMARASVVVRK